MIFLIKENNNLEFKRELTDSVIKEIIAWSFVSYDEKQELYKVNIRSRGPVINEIAQQFNGGGHKFASGARIKNVDDIDRLFKALDDACKTYKETNL